MQTSLCEVLVLATTAHPPPLYTSVAARGLDAVIMSIPEKTPWPIGLHRALERIQGTTVVLLRAGDRVQPEHAEALRLAQHTAAASIWVAPYVFPPSGEDTVVVPRQIGADWFGQALRGFVPALSALAFSSTGLQRLLEHDLLAGHVRGGLARRAVLMAYILGLQVRHVAIPVVLAADREDCQTDSGELARLFQDIRHLAELHHGVSSLTDRERELLAQSWNTLSLAPRFLQHGGHAWFEAANLFDAFEFDIIDYLRQHPNLPPLPIETIVIAVLEARRWAPRLYDRFHAACVELRDRGILQLHRTECP